MGVCDTWNIEINILDKDNKEQEKRKIWETREYVIKERRVKKNYLRKAKNFQNVRYVGAMFIDLLKKYEYVAS